MIEGEHIRDIANFSANLSGRWRNFNSCLFIYSWLTAGGSVRSWVLILPTQQNIYTVKLQTGVCNFSLPSKPGSDRSNASDPCIAKASERALFSPLDTSLQLLFCKRQSRKDRFSPLIQTDNMQWGEKKGNQLGFWLQLPSPICCISAGLGGNKVPEWQIRRTQPYQLGGWLPPPPPKKNPLLVYRKFPYQEIIRWLSDPTSAGSQLPMVASCLCAYTQTECECSSINWIPDPDWKRQVWLSLERQEERVILLLVMSQILFNRWQWLT